MAKILHIRAGESLSLQLHDRKQESYLLVAGQAILEWQNEQNEMITTKLKLDYGYHISVGQKHRLAALTDCDIVEVSTPEAGITRRLEDKYGRPDETPEQRAKERGELT